MVPKRVSPYFDKMEGNSTLVKGGIVCCDSHDFDVYIWGTSKMLFWTMYVLEWCQNCIKSQLQ